MKILTVYFDDDNLQYRRLQNVFLKSAKSYMPDTVVHMAVRLPPVYRQAWDAKTRHHYATYFAFMEVTQSALNWIDSDLEGGMAGSLYAVCDIDLMFAGSLLPMEKERFDIAYTVRNYRNPLNTGVWFFRSGLNARRFITVWREATQKAWQIRNTAHGKRMIRSFGGLDQIALNEARSTFKDERDFDMRAFECSEWNATQSEWADVDEKTRVIHVKSGLRDRIFNAELIDEKHDHPKMLELIADFKAWERAPMV